MMNLYKSRHFALTEIRITGKKQVGGTLCFEGLPSVWGARNEVLALEDGVVLRAGRCTDPASRDHKLGVCVTVSGHDGVSITYGRLACRFVKSGQYVKAGERIGIEGDSGSGIGQYLTLDFRRNGRRVDGCEYLGIPHERREFSPPDKSAADTVCEVCELTPELRSKIEDIPEAEALWTSLASKLAVK